jgi:hypothetical protein
MQNEEKTNKQLEKENKALIRENKRLVKENAACRAVTNKKVGERMPCEDFWFRKAMQSEKDVEKMREEVANMIAGIGRAVVQLDALEDMITGTVKKELTIVHKNSLKKVL